MRTAEIRLMATLLLAVLAIVATTCWLDLRSEGANPQTLGRGALLLGGAGACTVLGLAGLSRNRSQHRRLIHERVQAVLLGQSDLGGILLQAAVLRSKKAPSRHSPAPFTAPRQYP